MINLFCLTLYWWSGGLVITAVDLVLSNWTGGLEV